MADPTVALEIRNMGGSWWVIHTSGQFLGTRMPFPTAELAAQYLLAQLGVLSGQLLEQASRSFRG